MKVTYCLEVFIRSNKPHLQGVRISYTNGPTFTQYLQIVNDGVTLSVQFVDKDGDVRKETNYNFADINEYDCDGWVQPKVKPFPFKQEV